MAALECVFTSDATGQLFNICVWDIVSGSVLAQYKGNTSGPRTLCLLGSDYLVSAQPEKPVLQVWSLQRKDHKHMVCPGKVTALAASPDGSHCAAGIQEKIYVWQVSSGDLLAVLSRHFQPVTCLRFSDDGALFVSASRDGQVLAWDLADAVSANRGSAEPLHAWTQHSHDVTDLCVGLGGHLARVYSVSLDQTMRAYALDTGDALATAALDTALTAVAVDPGEDRAFVGGSSGKIFQVSLHNHESSESVLRAEATFTGHQAKVSCLSVSFDGLLLVSGSDDTTARVWDIPSKQCIHILHHKGALTNAFVALTPAALAPSTKPVHHPSLPLATFKRSMQTARDASGVTVNLGRASTELLPSFGKNGGLYRYAEECARTLAVGGTTEEGEMDVVDGGGEKEALKEVAALKQVNRQLYNYAWSCVLGLQEPPIKPQS
ncbi:unnamed protein product [Ixodes hexagonus]